jgi:hypothetical protein
MLQIPTEMFPAISGGGKKLAEELGVKFLGSLPLDPRLGRSCDDGTHFLTEFADSPAAKSLASIVEGELILLHYFLY